MKSFKPASRLAEFYIVQYGLQEGDIVVYEGIQSIKEGSRIIPQLRRVDELMGEDEDARERLVSEKMVY
jgi:membrane fusion protein (multidrug efflux system)